MKKVLLATHFNFSEKGVIHGPVHSVQDYLEKNKFTYTTLGYPLKPGFRPYKRVCNKNGKCKETEIGKDWNVPLLLKSFIELVYTIREGFTNKYDIYIGIDPVNAMAGVVLKLFGRIDKFVIYTVDYADIRYESKVLNKVYFWVDKITYKSADYIWTVSSRILNKRKKQGIEKNKLLLLPNSPDSEKIKPIPFSKVNKNWILVISGTTHTYTMDLMLDAFTKISRKNKEARLIIAGPPAFDKEFKTRINELNLNNKVIFKGQLEHNQLIKLIQKSGIGVALYTLDFPWIKYGDSMKAREYLAAGVPVIMNDAVATSDEIKKNKAGEIVKLNKDDISKKIIKILSNKSYHELLRQNARSLAEKSNFTDRIDIYFQYLSK